MNETGHRDLPRTVGFWGASSLMLGIIIGSGIFKTPTEIAKLMADPWLILGMWTAGGVLSLFGAFTFAELATMYPEAGGLYVFVREGFGRGAAFTMGWTYFLITKPAAAAGIAILFGETFVALTGLGKDNPEFTGKVVTTVVLITLTWINVRGLALSGKVAMVLTGLKLASLLFIVALGLPMWFTSGGALPAGTATTPVWSALAPVMMGVMWTYDGWSDVGAIAGEVKEPQRRLPAIYFTGTVVIMVVYVAVNAVYMHLVPLAEMKTTTNLAPIVSERLLAGTPLASAAGVLVALVVLISTIGSTHGSMATGGRVTYAQARDGLFVDALSAVHPRYGTPAASLVTQLVFSIAAVWLLKGFAEMADTFIFTVWIFYGMSGVTLFLLRWRRPDVPRPYRCWGYPVVPAVFVLAALAMTVLSVVSKPATTLPWLGALLLGYPAYFVWEWVRARRATSSEGS